MPKLSFNFHPSSSNLSWEEYFAEYSKQLADAKRLRDNEPEDDADIVEPITITEPARLIEDSEANGAALKLAKAARAMGWKTRLWRVIEHHDAVLFKAGDEVGAVRYAEKDMRVYLVDAKHPDEYLGMTVRYEGKDDPAIEAQRSARPYMSRLWLAASEKWVVPPQKNATFKDAFIRDPLGIPRYLEASYEGTKDAPNLHAAEQANAYNDGTSYLARALVLRKTSELNAWLDDWLGLLAPGHPKLTPAPKPEPTPNAVESFAASTEWSHT